jgi:hypothetical protein
VLREPGLSRLRDSLNALTFDSEADRAIYGLPPAVVRVIAITDRTSDRVLQSVSLSDIRAADPGMDQSSEPWCFAPLGYKLLQEPPVSTGLWAESSSASDTCTLMHAGIRAGGLLTGDISTTLTGVTRVQLGSLTDYVDVTALSLSLPAVGVVSIYDASSSGNVLAQIGVGARSPQYYVVQLYPTPSSVITFYVDAMLRQPDMTEDQDVPTLPEDFHDLLSDYVQRYHWEAKGDQMRAAMTEARIGRALSRLKYFVSSHNTDEIRMGRSEPRRYNRYDAMTPAEDWS